MEENIFFERLCLLCNPSLQGTTCSKLATERQEKNKVWNCSTLRMKTLERCQWHRSSVFIVNSEHISNFLLIIDFEQATVCWVHIENINTFEKKIRCNMRYVAVIKVWPKFINKYHLKLYYHNPMGESVRNLLRSFTLDFGSS